MTDTQPYDCTFDVMKHRRDVEYWMRDFADMLTGRASVHDASKLEPEEKPVFDEYTPKLKAVEFGSPEYKAALAAMGEGLRRHYARNSHHPEHYPNGVNGMTLYDLIEMVCDWIAAATAKGKPIDLNYLTQRFGIAPQLVSIIVNTLRDIDFEASLHGLPVPFFTPEDYRQKANIS